MLLSSSLLVLLYFLKKIRVWLEDCKPIWLNSTIWILHIYIFILILDSLCKTLFSWFRLSQAESSWVELIGLSWAELSWVKLSWAELIDYWHFNLRLFKSISLFKSLRGVFWLFFQELYMIEQLKTELISRFFPQAHIRLKNLLYLEQKSKCGLYLT